MIRRLPALFLLLAGVGLLPATSRTYERPIPHAAALIGHLYLNQGTSDRSSAGNDNAISGFAAYDDGRVELLPGSPWPTGGQAFVGPSFLASPRIGLAASADRLYAVDQGSDDIAAFAIATDGGLTPLAGSPFPSGGLTPEGVVLSPDRRQLFVGHSGSRSIVPFQIDAAGIPSRGGSPFDIDSMPDALTVTPDGRFLIVSLPLLARVAVLEIDANGGLRHAVGSPARSDANSGDGVALARGGAALYAADSDLGALRISRYNLGEDGRLSRTAGSPFTGRGGAASILHLTGDGRTLILTQTNVNTIAAVNIRADGTMADAPGSPIPAGPGALAPTGIASDPSGKFVYVVNALSSNMGVFRRRADGGLETTGDPVATGLPGLPLAGLVFVPRGDPDGDGVASPGDDCPGTPDPLQSDQDGDGPGDLCDLCPRVFDPGQRDADGDGVGDACDPDRDGDGVPDAVDLCPGVADIGQVDGDQDGVGDACDNCPAAANPGQEDADRDGEGDACRRPFIRIGWLYAQTEAPGNSIAGYEVDTLGRLRRLPGSPYLTAGAGPLGTTFFAPPRLAWSRLMPTLLFGANEGSDDLTAMRILPDGRLMMANGRTTASGGTGPAGLALMPHRLQLAVSHVGSTSLAMFTVQPTSGAMVGLAGFPIQVTGRTNGLAFSPSGDFLEMVLPDFGAARALQTSVPFGFVPGSGIGDAGGRPADIAFGFGGDRVYLSSSTVGPSSASAWSIDAAGRATRMRRSPLTAGGLNSNVLMMRPLGRYLYVSQQTSNTIGVLRVEASGALSPAGGPYDNAPFGSVPVGLASDPLGRFLFVTSSGSNTVASFVIAADGGLAATGESEKSGARSGRPLAGLVFVPSGDEDGDGLDALQDNCPAASNAAQTDADGDGAGDACDDCPVTADSGQIDSDGDGLGDACDPDRDGDGRLDAEDLCPFDADEHQEDGDGDRVGDACDLCPTDPLNDGDQDGSCADVDNCPAIANPLQEDTDADRLGDLCDNCVEFYNPGQVDIDHNGLGDVCERGFQQRSVLYLNGLSAMNKVAGFETKTTGWLLPLPGSPYGAGASGKNGEPPPVTAAGIALTPRARRLIVLNQDSRSVSVFRLDRNGVPMAIAGSPFAAGSAQPLGLAIDSEGSRLFIEAKDDAGGGLVTPFRLAASGLPIPIPGAEARLDSAPDGLAVSPDGTLLAVSRPGAARIDLFLIEADGRLTRQPGWDGSIAGLARPGPLLFTAAGSDPPTLWVASAAPDRAVLAAIDPRSGQVVVPPVDLGGAGGASAIVGSSDGDALFIALPGAGAVAALRGARALAPAPPPGSPYRLPAGVFEPVGLIVDGEMLQVSARGSNSLTTFRIAGDGALHLSDAPPISTRILAGHAAAGMALLPVGDEDGDGFNTLLDNCPGLANPDQIDANRDGAGDACQPEMSAGPAEPAIAATGGAAPGDPLHLVPVVAMPASVRDPAGHSLQGRAILATRESAAITLTDAVSVETGLLAIDCARGASLTPRPTEALAYLHAAFGEAVLIDQDGILGCDDAQGDYEIAPGECGSPGQAFDQVLFLRAVTAPARLCARLVTDPGTRFNLRLDAVRSDSVDLTVEREVARADIAWTGGRLPDRMPLAGLGLETGTPVTLILSAGDGETQEVRTRSTFAWNGESSLIFGQAPQVPVRPDQTVECASPLQTEVPLDGRDASDPDGGSLAWSWFETTQQGDAILLASGAEATARLSPGAHALELVVVDESGLAAARPFAVVIQDRRPPTIVAAATSPGALWPPNHRMVSVTMTLQAADACSGSLSVVLESVVSSDPDDAPGGGDGRTTGDIAGAAIGTDDRLILLRAERSGRGPARAYTATYKISDAAGNSATVGITIEVERQRRGPG